MSNNIRIFISLIVASITTAILGSLFSSQFVINDLIAIGADISMATRLSMSIDDFAILPALGAIVVVCFSVAFSVAGLCIRFIGGKQLWWFLAAGGLGLMATLLVMKAVFVVTAIAGTRSSLGFISFGVAGAIGGWIFANLYPPSRSNAAVDTKEAA